MIQAHLKIFRVFCLSLMLVVFATACTSRSAPANPLVGKWTSADGKSLSIEFFDDGRVSWSGVNCNYLITHDTALQVGCNGINSSGEFHIDGDKLTISSEKNSLVFKRVK